VHGWRVPEVLSRDFTTMSRLVNEMPVYADDPGVPLFDPSVAPPWRGWRRASTPAPTGG
jgi:hypothetical protein